MLHVRAAAVSAGYLIAQRQTGRRRLLAWLLLLPCLYQLHLCRWLLLQLLLLLLQLLPLLPPQLLLLQLLLILGILSQSIANTTHLIPRNRTQSSSLHSS